MPEPQKDNEQSDAHRVGAPEPAARNDSAREHDDILAALLGTDETSRKHGRAAASHADPASGTRRSDAAAPTPAASPDVPPQYGVGPFSLREVVLGGVWLIAFVVSFFSILPRDAGFTSVWTEGISWVLSIAVPTVAVFLIVLRRLSPSGIRRVGSLGIDQFASVAFSVAAVVWITLAWQSVVLAVRYTGSPAYTWVVWVESVLMLAGVVLTVVAPYIPGLEQDFQGRPEQPAHRLARPVQPVAVRPRPEPVAPAPTPAAPSPALAAAAPVPVPEPEPAPREPEPAPREPERAPEVPADTTVMDASASSSAEAETVAVPTVSQAFWALVPEQRPVVDASGRTLFFVGPTAWALVIEERGDVFVVRHEDGRVGYLRDVSGVTRG